MNSIDFHCLEMLRKKVSRLRSPSSFGSPLLAAAPSAMPWSQTYMHLALLLRRAQARHEAAESAGLDTSQEASAENPAARPLKRLERAKRRPCEAIVEAAARLQPHLQRFGKKRSARLSMA